jgi:predicted site-specific integrase-resolvase
MANDDDFSQDWEELCRAQKYDFQSYVSVDRHVARSGIETVEELCKAFGSTRSVEEEDKNEQEMVLRLMKLYKKLKHFSMRTVEVTWTMKTF